MAERNQRKTRVGVVVSDKMDKTVIIQVNREFMHPKYERTMRSNKKYSAHDATDECKMGDKVEITETRPLSKTKRWRVTRILEKAK